MMTMQLTPCVVVVEIPMKLGSASNMREHWSARHRRIKGQRSIVALAMGSATVRKGVARLRALAASGERLRATFVRISPGRLDSDNLQTAFKGIRDQVADVVGIDDGSEQWNWRYEQKKGSPGVRITVEEVVK